MLELVNETGWTAGLYPGWAADGRLQLTLVIKASYGFQADGALTPLCAALPIVEIDEHYGDPETTSLQAACETVPFKLGGEIYLYGTAHPQRPDAEVSDVSVALVRADGTRWNKGLRVFGPRRWKRVFLHHGLKLLGPVTPLPLRYEFAFGGRNPEDGDQQWLHNPVGMGYNPHAARLLSDAPPRIEMGPTLINAPTDKPVSAGFGPLPRFWEPRLAEGGEPVEDLQDGGCPYAAPVNPALHNAAPRDQRFPEPFKGAEQLCLRGLFPQGPGEVRLLVPTLAPRAISLIAGQREALTPVCDTLVLDTDAASLSLVFRAAIPWGLGDTRQGWVVIRDPDSASSDETQTEGRSAQTA